MPPQCCLVFSSHYCLILHSWHCFWISFWYWIKGNIYLKEVNHFGQKKSHPSQKCFLSVNQVLNDPKDLSKLLSYYQSKIHVYIQIHILYIYIYIYIHRHVCCPSQDSSVWLWLTNREKPLSIECSKHQVLSFAKMLVAWWTHFKNNTWTLWRA